MNKSNLDVLVVNNIKTLGLDMIKEAGSGHPGIVLSAANIIYTLYANHLNININDPKWLNRDRFVMSAGHGSALLYATLFMAGYLEIDDLKSFRKFGSKTPGHPEFNKTLGVDMSTGPLGEGIATAVGMALASRKLNYELSKKREKFLENDKSLINHKIYVLCSDGDLMEGISNEASSLAGHLNLNNLIILYDSNNMTLDGSTNLSFSEDVLLKYKAFGFNTIKAHNDIKSIDHAISEAKKSSRPTIIEVKTILGEGSIHENTNIVHGKVLDTSDMNQIKQKLNIPIDNPFFVNVEAKNYFMKKISDHTSSFYNSWSVNYNMFKKGEIVGNVEDYDFLFGVKKTFDVLNYDFSFSNDYEEEMRDTNNKILNVIAKNMFNFIGGSADLSSSNKTFIDDKIISRDDYSGKNICFGIRENAMGAILNGLSLYNYKVFGSTFLAFADFLKPSLRMSCLMNLDTTYIFTHDTVAIGPDGPTHQPIEQLSMLRGMPNLYVYRPCDANELIGCWSDILESNHPNALIVSKDKVKLYGNKEDTKKGAYIIKRENKKLDGILISSGTDVITSIHLANDLLEKYDIDLRVISMPCRELFLKQDINYKKELLEGSSKLIYIEASNYIEPGCFMININDYGISASKDDVLKYLHFDYETIKQKILNIIGKKV